MTRYLVMGAALEFDVTKLLKRLNPLEKSQVRYAGNIALKKIGFQIAKKEIPVEMQRYFDNPVPFTQRSINYSVANDTLTLRVNPDESKGNAPSKYLFPVTAAGDRSLGSMSNVYPTRFVKWLWNKGHIERSQYASPYTYNSRDVPKNRYGNASPAVYQRTQVALSRSQGTIGVTSQRLKKTGVAADRAIVVTGEKADKRTAHLAPGIYRVKGKKLGMLFSIMQGIPSRSAVFPYQERVFTYAGNNFPKEIGKQIQQAIANTPV